MQAQAAPNRLRELREAQGLQRYDLAAEFRVDQSTIARWEGGATVPDPIKRQLALRYGVSVEYLMGWDAEPTESAA